MNQATVVRLVEAFFRRWPLYLLLLVASVALGVAYIGRSPDLYEAKGTLSVEDRTLVTAQSGIRLNGNYSYLTPAQFATQEVLGLVATDVFMESVAERAGIELEPDVSAREAQLRGYRFAFYAFPTSGSIVQLGAITPDPELSANLTRALIDEYIDYHIGADKAESGASAEFFLQLVARYEDELDAARDALAEAVRGRGSLDELPAVEQLRIERLRSAEALVTERYQSAIDNLENARLAELQTNTDIEQSFVVLDSAEVPTASTARRLNDILDLAMFAVVGLLAAMTAPLVAALVTQQIMFPDDIEANIDLAVLARLPRSRKRRLDLRLTPEAGTGADDRSLWGIARTNGGHQQTTQPTESPLEVAEPLFSDDGGDSGDPDPSSVVAEAEAEPEAEVQPESRVEPASELEELELEIVSTDSDPVSMSSEDLVPPEEDDVEREPEPAPGLSFIQQLVRPHNGRSNGDSDTHGVAGADTVRSAKAD